MNHNSTVKCLFLRRGNRFQCGLLRLPASQKLKSRVSSAAQIVAAAARRGTSGGNKKLPLICKGSCQLPRLFWGGKWAGGITGSFLLISVESTAAASKQWGINGSLRQVQWQFLLTPEVPQRATAATTWACSHCTIACPITRGRNDTFLPTNQHRGLVFKSFSSVSPVRSSSALQLRPGSWRSRAKMAEDEKSGEPATDNNELQVFKASPVI